MKLVTITVEEYLFQFYQKIAVASGKTVEQVMADSLFRMAGELSVKAIREKNTPHP